MRIELKPAGTQARRTWVALSADPKLRATGRTPEDAVVALKRASLVHLAGRSKAGDVDYVIEWDMAPRRDVAERDRRVLGKVMKWKKLEASRPFTKLSGATFGWLVDERFVLPSQPMVVGANATQVRAFLDARPGVTASGYVVGSGRSDCRVEVEELVDARGKPVKIGRGRGKSTNIERQHEGVELSADLLVEETSAGWRWRSQGGAVSGVARTLEAARDAAARASWKALATRLADEDVLRAGAMRVTFEVKTTSEWVVDHMAPGDMEGRADIQASFVALAKALGPPLLDPFDGEPLYGWGLRGRKGKSAWIGIRIHDAEDEVSERDARAFAKTWTGFPVAATDDKAAKSVIAWVLARIAKARRR